MSMRRRSRSISLVILWLPLLAAAAPALLAKPRPPDAEDLIVHARTAVENGTADPARDLAPLVARLAASREESEQRHLIGAIERLGGHERPNPEAVKAYLRESAPPVLLAVARNQAAGTRVRCEALMALRSLNVADGVLDEAIALAESDRSPAQSEIAHRGRLLADWKATRRDLGLAAAASPPAGPPSSKEEAALAFLRRHRRSMSVQDLGQAAAEGKVDLVVALLDAGVDPNGTAAAGIKPLSFAVMGCGDARVGSEALLATFDALLQHGADAKWQDRGGNTILMEAAGCPLPVVEKLVAAGARVDAANAQGFSPLLRAFALGSWEVAGFLVERGARASKKAIDEVFFELPDDPKKRALIRRATR